MSGDTHLRNFTVIERLIADLEHLQTHPDFDKIDVEKFYRLGDMIAQINADIWFGRDA